MTGDDCVGYGMRHGQLLSIAEVQRGLSCGCTCVSCGKALIAKKGIVRRHHFAHYEATSCSGAAESALHLLAKELISRFDEIDLPVYQFRRTRSIKGGGAVKCDERIVKGGRVGIQRAWIERNEGDVIADIVIESNGKPLIIEVAVTHKVARDKLRKLRQRNIPAIEIRLHPEDSFLSREDLLSKLQQDLKIKHWLFHPKQREHEGRFTSLVREALAAARMRKAGLPVPELRRGVTLLKPYDRLSLQPGHPRMSGWARNFGESTVGTHH